MSDETQVLTVEPAAVTQSSKFAPVMRSPLTEHHRRLNAELVIEDGWELPRSYGDLERERRAIREGLGIADITSRGKIDIRGNVDSSLARVPQTRGAQLARLSRDWALVLTPAATHKSALHLMEQAAGRTTMVTDATSIYAGIALLGPRVPELLLRLTAVDLAHLTPGHSLVTQMLRIPAILLRRDLAAMVVEAYVASEFARYAWDAVFNAGHPLQPEPVGWDALRAEGWR
jgi:glycine cleavage system T protein (aminomethyltransferase)